MKTLILFLLKLGTPSQLGFNWSLPFFDNSQPDRRDIGRSRSLAALSLALTHSSSVSIQQPGGSSWRRTKYELPTFYQHNNALRERVRKSASWSSFLFKTRTCRVSNNMIVPSSDHFDTSRVNKKQQRTSRGKSLRQRYREHIPRIFPGVQYHWG